MNHIITPKIIATILAYPDTIAAIKGTTIGILKENAIIVIIIYILSFGKNLINTIYKTINEINVITPIIKSMDTIQTLINTIVPSTIV